MASNTMVQALEIVLDVVHADDAYEVLMLLEASPVISSELVNKKQDVYDRIYGSTTELLELGGFRWIDPEMYSMKIAVLLDDYHLTRRFTTVFTLPGIKDDLMLLCIKWIAKNCLFFGYQVDCPYGFSSQLYVLEEELGINAKIKNILARWDESDVLKLEPSVLENAKQIVKALDNLDTPENYECPPDLFIDEDWWDWL